MFCQNSRLIERYRERDRAVAGRCRQLFPAGAGGRGDRPRCSWRWRCTATAIEKARPDETIDGISLAGAARDHRFRLLLRLAGRRARRGSGTMAAARLESAAEVARSDAERLQAQLLAGRRLARRVAAAATPWRSASGS